MKADETCTHVVILRAADAKTDGANAQVKIGMLSEPSAEVLAEYREAITTLFRKSFGQEPARVGVGVLPWVEELDGDEAS